MLVWCMGAGSLLADIKGTGQIKFDFDRDSVHEMVLDSDGLTIGSASGSANVVVGGNTLVTGQMSIGSSQAPSSNLSLSGTMAFGVTSTSSDLVVGDSSHVLVDTASGNVLVPCPWLKPLRVAW